MSFSSRILGFFYQFGGFTGLFKGINPFLTEIIHLFMGTDNQPKGVFL